MTDFTITITDQDELDGITWAKDQYNLTLPKDTKGNTIDALDDTGYIEFVMKSAVVSYAQSKDRTDLAEANEAASQGDPTKLQAYYEAKVAQAPALKAAADAKIAAEIKTKGL